jgi:tetratricopeptide (TPR) repeat protein
VSKEDLSAAQRRREETIVPIGRPPTRAVSPPPAALRAPRRLPLVGVAAAVLGLLFVAVFFVLPRWVEQQQAERAARAAAAASAAAAAAPAAATAPALPALSAEEHAALKDQAEALLADLLEQQDALERRSVGSWGEIGYERYTGESRQGDDALLADDVRQAVDRYTAALDIGRDLMMRSEELMASALVAGDAALAAGNAELAIEQYDLVLTVDPDNARAAHGRSRAERVPAVIAAMRRGDEARQTGDLGTAAKAYGEAREIDPEWTRASDALRDVNASLAAARFEGLLSRGFAALDSEEYSDAAELFRQALAMRPGSEPASDGLEQAEQGEKLDAIALAEVRALAFERRELWQQAIERYEAALETDATLAFALSGLERSRARADLDSKLENLIGNPDLLLNEGVLRDAGSLLDAARPLADDGSPRLSGQVERLTALVTAASTPISVQFESDGETEVTVYRVGQLGSFSSLEMELKPGKYTAVGSRRGFRDVRLPFTVLPGRAGPVINVVCSEPI